MSRAPLPARSAWPGTPHARDVGLATSMRVWSQPLVVVPDVPTSSRFYATLLGADSAHGGEEYEQIVCDGELVLQLHHLEAGHHHGPLASSEEPLGNGVLLWFEVSDFDAAVERARRLGATIERDVHVNPNAGQRELWLRDPDGYLVVLAGESPYRPRGRTANPAV